MLFLTLALARALWLRQAWTSSPILRVLKVSLCEVGSMFTTKYRFIPGIWLVGPKGKAGRPAAPETGFKPVNKRKFESQNVVCGSHSV